MKSLLSVLPVTVLVVPLCALAGIVARASERARRAKDPRRLGAGRSNGPGARRPRAASAPGCQEVEGGTARRERFVVDEKAAFARRGGNGAGATRKGGRVL